MFMTILVKIEYRRNIGKLSVKKEKICLTKIVNKTKRNNFSKVLFLWIIVEMSFRLKKVIYFYLNIQFLYR